MARFLARLTAMNDGWAQPFGEFNLRWTVGALPRDRADPRSAARAMAGSPPSRGDTDIPIGLLLGCGGPRRDRPADGGGHRPRRDDPVHGAAAVAGLADYSETERHRADAGHAPRDADDGRAASLLVVSAVMRAGAPTDRTIPIALSIIAFLVVTAGAFVGGDVVYVAGNMVSRHAFRGAGTSGSGSTPARSRTSRSCPRPRRPRCEPGRTTSSSSGSATRSARCTTSARTPAAPPRRARGRRLHRVPVARVAIPLDRRSGRRAPRSTTSRPTRSVPLRRADTKCGGMPAH